MFSRTVFQTVPAAVGATVGLAPAVVGAGVAVFCVTGGGGGCWTPPGGFPPGRVGAVPGTLSGVAVGDSGVAVFVGVAVGVGGTRVFVGVFVCGGVFVRVGVADGTAFATFGGFVSVAPGAAVAEDITTASAWQAKLAKPTIKKNIAILFFISSSPHFLFFIFRAEMHGVYKHKPHAFRHAEEKKLLAYK